MIRCEFFPIKVSRTAKEAYINTALIRFPGEEEPRVLDREETNWTFVEYPNREGESEFFLHMDWQDVYLWDGENKIPIPKEYTDGFGYIICDILGFEIEDDAPEDYKILQVECRP